MTLIVYALDGSIASKECSKCRRFLPPSEFSKAKWLKGGLRSDCFECRQKKTPNTLSFKEVARSLGQNRYIGKPCKRCGGFVRKVSNGGCVACAVEAHRKDAEGNRRRRQRYYKECYEKLVANNKLRECAKKHRTPAWLTAEHKVQMEAFYKKAHTRTKSTGTKMHVDHVVPLQGKTVCGLHVPWNLQVITASENLAKNNRLLAA